MLIIPLFFRFFQKTSSLQCLKYMIRPAIIKKTSFNFELFLIFTSQIASFWFVVYNKKLLTCTSNNEVKVMDFTIYIFISFGIQKIIFLHKFEKTSRKLVNYVNVKRKIQLNFCNEFLLLTRFE